MSHRSVLVAAVLGLAAFLSEAPLGIAAQATPTEREARLIRGWIGISVDVLADLRGDTRRIMIRSVARDSPAALAGLLPGDDIISINEFEGPEELANLHAHLQLQAGDDVAVVFQRRGRLGRVTLQASTRPEPLIVDGPAARTPEGDVIVQGWVQAMDSLRVALLDEPFDRLRRDAEGWPSVNRPLRAPGRTPEIADRSRVVRTPFEFFLFPGESHDSLHREMLLVNRIAEELDILLTQRDRQLRRHAGSSDVLDFRRDYEFRWLSDALVQIEDRASELETAMAASAHTTAGFQNSIYAGPQPAVPTSVTVEEHTAFRLFTPYLLGRDRVAGARLLDLTPDVAQQFGVSRAILVLDVAVGTPASLAGIVPGDVITRIGQSPARSVSDLRSSVSLAKDDLRISLIRLGTPIEVSIKR